MAIGQIPKKAKLESLINFKVRVTATNTSQFIGTLLSFDKHMNLVLSDCEEFRLLKKSFNYIIKENKKNNKTEEIDELKIKEQKRLLGLVILRGENIVSVVVESAPNLNTLKPQLRLNKGKGTVKPLVKKLVGDEKLNVPVRTEGVMKFHRGNNKR